MERREGADVKAAPTADEPAMKTIARRSEKTIDIDDLPDGECVDAPEYLVLYVPEDLVNGLTYVDDFWQSIGMRLEDHVIAMLYHGILRMPKEYSEHVRPSGASRKPTVFSGKRSRLDFPCPRYLYNLMLEHSERWMVSVGDVAAVLLLFHFMQRPDMQPNWEKRLDDLMFEFETAVELW